MCGYFCIGFIGFMLAGKKLADFTDLFSRHEFKKNDNKILSYFKNQRMQQLKQLTKQTQLIKQNFD